MTAAAFDPELDLLFERVVPTSRRLVWRAWTEPETLIEWFCPRPWETVSCDIDLRPGGRFATVMRSPEGVEVAGANCYLLVEPERRLVWTSALTPGFRPHAQPTSDADFVFTADLTLGEEAGGTLYRAHLMHATAKDRQRHEDLGFQDGWGAALDQLVEAMAGQF